MMQVSLYSHLVWCLFKHLPNSNSLRLIVLNVRVNKNLVLLLALTLALNRWC